jgi:hypothetical protein
MSGSIFSVRGGECLGSASFQTLMIAGTRSSTYPCRRVFACSLAGWPAYGAAISIGETWKRSNALSAVDGGGFVTSLAET